jgi:GNAT superfamily N-acetyltransferase
MDSSGTIVGIACVVTLSDTGKDALLWLEVLQAYQQRGVGKTLLKWAQKQTHQKLVIKSVPSAVGFYHAAM